MELKKEKDQEKEDQMDRRMQNRIPIGQRTNEPSNELRASPLEALWHNSRL